MKTVKTFKMLGLGMAMACLAGNAAAMENVDHSKMDHAQMDHSQMDHSQMDHSQMDHSQMDHSQMDHSQHGTDEHAQHRAMMNQEGYTRKQVNYQLPDVMLTNQYGEKVSTATLLGGDETVMLNFIFTSCTTICPVLSATFSQVQNKYGSQIDNVKMISISIDPEYDTPERLNQYAQRFHAKEGWTFLTGDLETVIEVLSAFDAYRGNKMNHIPLALISTPEPSGWIRLEGFASASDLINEYEALKIEHSVEISQR